MNYASIVKVVSDVGATIVMTALLVWLLTYSAPKTHTDFQTRLEHIQDRQETANQHMLDSINSNTKTMNDLNIEIRSSRMQRAEEKKVLAKVVEDVGKAMPKPE